MRKLSEQQREKLMGHIKQIFELEQKIWGLLPPSEFRDSARIRLRNAQRDLENLFFYEEEPK